jgi:general secretion pathway protein C
MGVGGPAAPAYTVSVSDAPAVRGDLTRLLGAAAPEPVAVPEATVAPEMASRFRLVGVVAPKSPRRLEGLALIAVDGKPAKAYRVGAAIDGNLVLQSVHARGAALGMRGGPPDLTLELPALPPPATGVPGGVAAGGVAPGGMPAAPAMFPQGGNVPTMIPALPQGMVQPGMAPQEMNPSGDPAYAPGTGQDGQN